MCIRDREGNEHDSSDESDDSDDNEQMQDAAVTTHPLYVKLNEEYAAALADARRWKAALEESVFLRGELDTEGNELRKQLEQLKERFVKLKGLDTDDMDSDS